MATTGVPLAASYVILLFALLGVFKTQTPVWAQTPDGCVMYGQCGEGDYGNLNCVYNGKPKVITDPEVVATLKAMCPEYVDGNQALTCCDSQQIESMDANFKLPQRLLGGCPSCFANFKKTFCRLTCAPQQNQYIKVMDTTKNEEGQDMVTELVYFVTNNFANGLFNSCRDVEGIIPGTRVIDMMCGSWGPKCNGERWLQFMGSIPKNSGFSPFQINYNLTDETEILDNNSTYYPMNQKTPSCSESPAPGEGVCGCSDCPDACAKSTESTTVSTTATIKSTANAKDRVSTQSPEVRPIDGFGSTSDTSGAAESKPKFFDSQLFKRVLSPLVVIAPGFAD